MNSSTVSCPVHNDSTNCSLFWEFSYYDQRYTLYHCTSCDLIFYSPFPNVNYENHTDSMISIKDYVDLNCNITGLIKVLLKYMPQNCRSILEVGGGFGFTIDFAKHILGMEVVGFEPSTYGELGSKELSIDIRRTYLTADSLPGKKYDIIFLSEVLEHVTDPGSFINLLKGYLSEQGVLILTTPNYKSIKRDIKNSNDLSALSPGAHTILFSANSLKKTLDAAGFKYIDIQENGSLISVSSAKQVQWKEFENESELITKYYQNVLARIKPDQLTYPGIVFRLFKAYIESANYEQAAQLIKTHPFPDLPTAENILDIKKMEDFYNPWPVSSGLFYYYRGMLFLNYYSDFTTAAFNFSAAFLLCRKKSLIIPEYSVQEQAHLWSIKFHLAISLYHAGSYMFAMEAANEIINYKKNPENHSLPQPEEHILEASAHLYDSIKNSSKESVPKLFNQPVEILLNKENKKAKEIQDWYNKEYEVLPLWFKRIGHIIKIATGKRSLFKKPNQN